MTHNSKTQKSHEVEPTKGKNLILVSNNSDIFGIGDPTYEMLYPRTSSHNGGNFRRTSSVSNLFPAFRPDQGLREDNFHRQEPMTDAQRYAQECLQYQKYHFDDKIRLIIHRMAILAYHSFRQKNDHPFLTFFIERFMCTLAKKLLLNRFELLFLEYVFQQSKWKYDNEIISQCVDQFKSFIHIPQSETSRGMIKNLQIYLLFCAYYSKKSLNDITQEAIYNSFFRTISDKFKERYQEWYEASGIKVKINPKLLNVIFRKLTMFQDKEREYIQNYNLLVEDILEISPAYNADKEGKVKKKKKKNAEEEERDYQLKSDSNMQPIQANNEIPQEESPPEFSALNFRKKQTSYVSNVDGLDPVAYCNRSNN